MLKMGLPMGAVKNALQRDGKDPSIMDLDPEKSVKSQTGGGAAEDDGPPLKEDPEYEKVRFPDTAHSESICVVPCRNLNTRFEVPMLLLDTICLCTLVIHTISVPVSLRYH